MEGEFRPAHKLTMTKSKGKFISSCICGWKQIGKSESYEEAEGKYKFHSGVFERVSRR